MATLITTAQQEWPCSSRMDRVLVSLGNVKKKDVQVCRVTSKYGECVVISLKKSDERNALAGHILYKRDLLEKFAAVCGPVIIATAEEYDGIND